MRWIVGGAMALLIGWFVFVALAALADLLFFGLLHVSSVYRPQIVAVLAGVSLLLGFYLTQRYREGGIKERRFARGLCPFCGYDLRANESGRCPECGRFVWKTRIW